MASALASLPPPFHYGPSDPRANARRFLERALVISALIHFTVVGLFRAAEERMVPREERGSPDIPRWKDPVIFTPHIVPIPPGRPVPNTPSENGVIVPVGRKPIFQIFDPGKAGRTIPGVPGEVKGIPPGPSGPTGSPPDDQPAFVVVADTPPVPISAPKPAYPEWAREAGIEGKVLLRALVGIDGLVKKVVVASGPTALSGGAAEAVARWTFRPGLSNKRPVEVWVEIPVAFRLSGE